MPVVEVSSIFVDRAERQRREITPQAIEKLASSISRAGRLIHPPTIERSGKLRVGETRWEAVKFLGWTHMEVQYVEDLDENQLYLLELEENLARVDLPWQDECAAVLRYHELQLSDPTWTATKTADALGMSVKTVSAHMDVGKALRKGENTLVTGAEKFSTARGIVQRSQERAKASAITSLAVKLNPTGAVAKAAAIIPTVPLLHADFHDWEEDYEGERDVNFVHCDFPYGIDAGEHHQGQGKSQGGYEDTFGVYEALLRTLGHAMETVVSDSAHLMFWFSMDYYQWTLDALTAIGWKVQSKPLIWVKNDGTGILPDPTRGPRWGYETAFLASRGDRKIVRAKTNWVAHPGKDKSIHMSEKPVPMLKHFMEMLVDNYTVMLDPTCGSGNAVKAAQQLGASRVLGLERDEEFYNRAKEAYFDDQA